MLYKKVCNYHERQYPANHNATFYEILPGQIGYCALLKEIHYLILGSFLSHRKNIYHFPRLHFKTFQIEEKKLWSDKGNSWNCSKTENWAKVLSVSLIFSNWWIFSNSLLCSGKTAFLKISADFETGLQKLFFHLKALQTRMQIDV